MLSRVHNSGALNEDFNPFETTSGKPWFKAKELAESLFKNWIVLIEYRRLLTAEIRIGLNLSEFLSLSRRVSTEGASKFSPEMNNRMPCCNVSRVSVTHLFSKSCQPFSMVALGYMTFSNTGGTVRGIRSRQPTCMDGKLGRLSTTYTTC